MRHQVPQEAPLQQTEAADQRPGQAEVDQRRGAEGRHSQGLEDTRPTARGTDSAKPVVTLMAISTRHTRKPPANSGRLWTMTWVSSIELQNSMRLTPSLQRASRRDSKAMDTLVTAR